MIIHHEELSLARAYEQHHEFEGLTDQQLTAVMTRGRALFQWYKAHPGLHNLITLASLALLFVADYLVLVRLPGVFLPPGATHTVGSILLASAVAGSLHSYLLYSLGVYSLHEGAAHHMMFVGRGPLGDFGRWVSTNLSRISAGEPECYAPAHMGHHAKFGTEDDPEFLNHVLPERYFLTFLPFAAFINFTDFVAHRPLTYTSGRMKSAAAATAYNLTYGIVIYRLHGGLFTLLTMFVFLPHVGFFLDRLRQFTEHNLMPLDNRNGSRSFGAGFWGMLVGGGPWGSPCHWEHHLVPSVPWYQQLILHRHLVRLLTPRQREQFLIAPIVGFPRLWWRILRELRTFRAQARVS